MTTRSVLALVATLVVATSGSANAQGERIGLQVRVNTAYDDSPQNLAEIRSLFRVLPPQTVQVPAGVSLSGFIVATYGIGPTLFPETYKLIESEVMSLNGITSPTRFQAGLQKVPSLPKRALTLPNLEKVINRIPKLMSVQVMSADTVDMARASTRITRSETSREGTREGSASVSIDVDLPRSYYDTVAGDPIFDGTRARVISQELHVRLAQEPPVQPGGSNGFTQPELARIQRALASGVRKASVYIVDSGWPDQDTRQRSVEAIMSLLNDMRTRWRLGFPVAVPTLPDWAETFDHCKKIRNAIAPIQAVDAQTSIRAIYVPLSKAQGGDLVLRQILIVDYMMRTLGLQLGQVDATSDLIAKATEWADSELTRYPSAITSDLLTTNKAIVEALANVLSRNNQSHPDDFFVMNLSWVVVGSVLDVRLPTPLGGVVVVAAGNDPGVNVNTAKIDLAQRSLTDHHVLAVMNLDRAGGVLCNSSQVDLAFPSQVFAVGFDGRVDTAACGTSFSAPRVAFLIAAFQASRARVPAEATWNADLFSRFLAARNGNSGLTQFVLDPVSFLDQP